MGFISSLLHFTASHSHTQKLPLSQPLLLRNYKIFRGSRMYFKKKVIKMLSCDNFNLQELYMSLEWKQI